MLLILTASSGCCFLSQFSDPVLRIFTVIIRSYTPLGSPACAEPVKQNMMIQHKLQAEEQVCVFSIGPLASLACPDALPVSKTQKTVKLHACDTLIFFKGYLYLAAAQPTQTIRVNRKYTFPFFLTIAPGWSIRELPVHLGHPLVLVPERSHVKLWLG